MQTGTDAADQKSKHKQRGGSGGLEVFVVWRFQVRLNTAHSTPRCQVLLTSDRKSQEGGLGCTNDWHRWRRQRTKVRMEAHDSVLMPGSQLGLLPAGTHGHRREPSPRKCMIGLRINANLWYKNPIGVTAKSTDLEHHASAQTDKDCLEASACAADFLAGSINCLCHASNPTWSPFFARARSSI